MVKRNIYIKWGKKFRKAKVEIKNYEKVGKQGRFNTYQRKKKQNKKKKSLYFSDRKKYYKKKESIKTIRKNASKTIIKKKKQVAKKKDYSIKTKKTKKLNDLFDKKNTKINIKDILKIPTSELKNEYRPLIKNALKGSGLGDFANKEVIEAMIKNENIQKIKWRFDMRAVIYDRSNNKIAEMQKGEGGDLITLKEVMKKGIWKGARIEYNIELDKGYNFQLIKEGNVDRVEVTIVFRS